MPYFKITKPRSATVADKKSSPLVPSFYDRDNFRKDTTSWQNKVAKTPRKGEKGSNAARSQPKSARLSVGNDKSTALTFDEGDNTTRKSMGNKIEYTDSPWHYITMMIVTIPIFMGYACLNVGQKNLRDRLGIIDASHEAKVFNIGISFLYLGNMMFRLLHNLVFSFLRPRSRVIISYFGMMIAVNLLGWLMYIGSVKNLAVVYISYLLGGVSIGTFESNVMSVLTPLGHRAKSWAIVGLPLGFNLVSIGSFIVLFFSNTLGVKFGVYMAVFLACIVGLIYFLLFVEDIPSATSNDNLSKFFADLKLFRNWFFLIWTYCLALTLDKFCLGLFGSIQLYMFSADRLPIWPNSAKTIQKNLYYGLYSLCCFLGDSISRKVAYSDEARNPLYFLILSAIGAALILCKVLLLSFVGIFLIFYANGSIYAHNARRIDQRVGARYNLIAISASLFIGDLGSFTGANLNSHVPRWIGKLYTW